MLQGVYTATKKDKTLYYRSSITYKNKHISLFTPETVEKSQKNRCNSAKNRITGRTIFLSRAYKICYAFCRKSIAYFCGPPLQGPGMSGPQLCGRHAVNPRGGNEIAEE